MEDSNSHREKMQRFHEYIEALERERLKIQVFQRELPLCLELVTQAIDTCKQQMSGTSTTECFLGQSECSEETSSLGPVLEQFIPLKRNSSSDDDEQSHQKISRNQSKDEKNDDKVSKKSDWLRSAQLWNQTPDPPTKQDSPRKVTVMEAKKNGGGGGGGAFHPFKKDKSVGGPQTSSPPPPPAVAVMANSAAEMNESGSSGGGGCGGEKKEDREGQSQRKARRCWSPELHRRFLHALQQLGGSHVATPKQIRELMKVDGLTNDEVKSHLQKYRLHTRRPSTSTQSNSNPPPPQFVVVGGLWVPPPEYAAAATTASGEASGVTSPNGIYAPIASHPPPPTATHVVSPVTLKQTQSYKQSNHSAHSDEHSEGRVHSSNSPATSSSTHTTTASPVY